MPAALPLPSYISQATQGQTSYKVLEVKYGNGYGQRAGDGYNNNQASWSVDWGTLSLNDFNTVVAALDAARGTDYFTWQAPGDSASKKWVVKAWSRTALSGSFYQVSATLEQVFDV